MSGRRRLASIQLIALLAGSAVAWAARPMAPDLSDIFLGRQPQGTVALQSLVREGRFTAIVFFSATCPCFAAHRARLAALAREMASRDVRFLIVDSERHPPRTPGPAFVTQTDLPIFRDAEGRLARRLQAQLATETFVFDGAGALRYRGGVDDDRKILRASARATLRDELLALLAGTAPAFTEAKTLGCTLRLL